MAVIVFLFTFTLLLDTILNLKLGAMKTKKTPKVDIEGKKGIFFEIGLTLALAIVLFAFEWKASTEDVYLFQMPSIEVFEEEIIPITQQRLKSPPPPPPLFKNIDFYELVENVTDIDEELEIIDSAEESDYKKSLNMNNIWTTGEDYPDEEDIFIVVEDPPVFPHGNVSTWVSKRIKYPVLAQENGIEGRVYIKFVIERDGSVTNIEIVRGADASLDKEAIRVVQSMPKWKPGKQRGKAVRCSFQMPINFQLESR